MHQTDQPNTLPTPQPVPYVPQPVAAPSPSSPAVAHTPAEFRPTPQPVSHVAPQPQPYIQQPPQSYVQSGGQAAHQPAPQIYAPHPQVQQQMLQQSPNIARTQMPPQMPQSPSGLPPMPGLAPVSAVHVPDAVAPAADDAPRKSLLKGLRSRKKKSVPAPTPLLQQEVRTDAAKPRSTRSVFLTGLLSGLVLAFVGSVALSKLGGDAPVQSAATDATAMQAARAAMAETPATDATPFIDQALQTP